MAERLILLALLGCASLAHAGLPPEELAAWLPMVQRQGDQWRVRACAPAEGDVAQALAVARMLAQRDLARQRGESRLSGREQWARGPTPPGATGPAGEGFALEIHQELRAQIGPVRVRREAVIGQGPEALACVEIEEVIRETTRESHP